MLKLVLALFALLSFDPLAIATAQTPITDGAPWSVEDQLEIDVDGTPLLVSPDGNWIAGPGEDNDFCIWSIPDLDPSCDGDRIRIAEGSVSWAPDSSAVAFSHNPAVDFRDSDIQVFDIANKEVVNLTDDPVENQQPSLPFNTEDGVTHADAYPVWSADGSSIFFVRGDLGGEVKSTVVMSLSIATGEISNYFTVSPDVWFTVYSPMHLLPDGSLVINVLHPELDNPQNGVWKIAPGGSRIDPIANTSSSESTPIARISDVSADGSSALLTSLTAYDLSFDATEESPYLMLDLETGEMTEVPYMVSESDHIVIAAIPQFVGDSTEIIYPVAELNGSSADIVIGISDPYPVLEEMDAGLVRGGIQWSESNLVLVRGADGSATVLSLEQTMGEATPAPPCSCLPPEAD